MERPVPLQGRRPVPVRNEYPEMMASKSPAPQQVPASRPSHAGLAFDRQSTGIVAGLDVSLPNGQSIPIAAGVPERHYTAHIGWLRASVLGANDGLISTSSLVVGVAAAQPERGPVLLAAMAGLVAGALSMAAGEYVSVSSQSDTEKFGSGARAPGAGRFPEHERRELAAIYVKRGLTPELAEQVAEQLMADDALGAHARDELGIHELTRARPIQAALASAASFAAGASLPLLVVVLLPFGLLSSIITGSTLVLLLFLGALAAKLGGAPMTKGAIRVAFWGGVAMGATALVGRLFKTVV